MKDTDPTPQELREAETLARSLAGEEGGPTPDSATAQALQTANLLRASTSWGELDPGRRAAVLDRVLPHPAPRRAWTLRWLVPAGAAAALALFALLVWLPPRPTPLPRPEAPLIRAQARATSGSQDLLELEREMRSYRAQFYTALRARYAG